MALPRSEPPEPPESDPDPTVPRRTFLRLAGAGAVGAFLPGVHMAGPFSSIDAGQTEFERLIPADKKLNPDWVASLTERGLPTQYTGDALQHIGMPVGGICCGLVYLSGDGRLWHWDIFNANLFGVRPGHVDYNGQSLGAGDGSAYVDPPKPSSPFEFGFRLQLKNEREREMDHRGWSDIIFTGQYPVGQIAYSDSAVPLKVELTAFSPFIPLDFESSSLPMTYLRYRVTNPGHQPAEGKLTGRLGNPVARRAVDLGRARHVTEIRGRTLQCGVVPVSADQSRPDLKVEDWNRSQFAPWKAEGDAFGKGPILRKDVPSYQGDLGGDGARVVNSHAGGPADTVEGRDSKTGKLTSPPIKLERRFLNLWIGGGNHPGKTCLNVLVEGKVVATVTGHDSNRMREAALDLHQFQGREAVLEIVDQETGAWGHIGVGRIWLSDEPADLGPLKDQPDFGTIALTALGKAAAELSESGEVAQSFSLKPGESVDLEFAVSWHFANVRLGVPDDKTKRHYAKRFKDAAAVAAFFTKNRKRLVETTELWRDTWYGQPTAKGLPHWFLERTVANASTLATTVCHRFGSGRFYAWEGVGCCAGTCAHVWHYAHCVGRLFPELERDTRERVDLGIAFNQETGGIGFRAEFDHTAAIDGQAGTICRILREHQTSTDDAFLKRVWPRTKQAIEYLMKRDPKANGLIEGEQPNTHDAAWYGESPFMSSLYLASLAAGKTMATAMNDPAFGEECAKRLERGREAIKTLFNGEYFYQKTDPAHADAFGPYEGCHADQVFGQSWAFQVGLGRVMPQKETRQALQALWKYNFAPDVGPFRNKERKGRWYAFPGDAGLIVVTNPKELPNPYHQPDFWASIYFNECWTGVEHQVAGHMIAEDMVTEGLAIVRAVHDRHSALRRNPYNEIECSDHYARAMSSFGPFITLTGFTYDGPTGKIGFAPKLTQAEYEFPFLAAAGWGVFRKTPAGYEMELRHGELSLSEIELPSPVSSAHLPGGPLKASIDDASVRLSSVIRLAAGDRLLFS